MTDIAGLRLGWNWWIIFLEGLAALILGAFLVASPGATMVVLINIVGAYLLANGLVSLVRLFRPDRGAHWGWSLVIALVSIVAGAYFLANSLYSTAALTTALVLALGIVTVGMGVVYIVKGFRGEGCGAIVIGALWILLGVVLINNRMISTVVLVYAVGILGILGGIILMVLAFVVRRNRREGAAEPAG